MLSFRFNIYYLNYKRSNQFIEVFTLMITIINLCTYEHKYRLRYRPCFRHLTKLSDGISFICPNFSSSSVIGCTQNSTFRHGVQPREVTRVCK